MFEIQHNCSVHALINLSRALNARTQIVIDSGNLCDAKCKLNNQKVSYEKGFNSAGGDALYAKMLQLE